MIKTLKVDEFDLIRKTFLNEYEKYIKKNPNSLLCRIYGMYNIILSQGEEILIIVMRNVIGEFKEYVMAKYDLKGSTKNRVTEFDMEKLGEITLKDLNFNELEKGIKMSSDSIATFRTLIKYDALFLRKMELMDYSLFLVKLTLSKEQISDLFGEEIQDIQENEYKELMEGSGVNNNNIVTSFTFNEKRFNYGDIYVKERKVKIKENVTKFTNSKYYKQYIYPSLVPGQAYILAIIDYFQIFNFYKYVEATFKGIGGKGNNGNSCVEPRTYAKRFINYFNLLTDIKFMLKIDKNNDPNNFVIIEEMIDENEVDDLDFLINIDNDSDKKQNVELKFIG